MTPTMHRHDGQSPIPTISSSQRARVLRHDFPKEQKHLEFETKFSITRGSVSSMATLRKIRTSFRAGDPWLLCTVRGGDLLRTRVQFFASATTEYSLFAYRGARMLKVKQHTVLPTKPFPLYKNTETLLIDRQDFLRKLSSQRHRFQRHAYRLVNLTALLHRDNPRHALLGTMVKERVKDFVVDRRSGRIYAVAVTHCSAGKAMQRQLEVEYAGYLAGSFHRVKNSQREIINGVMELSQFLFLAHRTLLASTTERKFTFVQRHI